MNPERLTVVPEPGHVMEVVSSTLLLHGRGSIHLTRTDDGTFDLKVRNGVGYIHFDKAAATQLCQDLNAELLLDEAEHRLLPGESIDQITPSTAEFLREDAAREAAWDESHGYGS